MPMTIPYLDKFGLARFWNNIKERMPKSEKESLQKALMALPGMTRVKIISNDGEISGDKLRGCDTPVGMMEVCYYGAREEDVGRTIFEHKNSITQTYGMNDVEIEDEEGIIHKVCYTSMTETGIVAQVTGVKLQGWTDESEDLIKSRIAEIVKDLDFGEDVIATNIKTAINDEYAAVFSASSLQVGSLSGSVGETVEIVYRKHASIRASDITITYVG